MKMNQEIKEEWVALLECGGLTQIRKRLANQDGGYCCLGVLCEIAVAHGVVKRKYNHFGNPSEVLPRVVQEWAGIDSSQGYCLPIDQSLTSLNDQGKTFKQIAKIIEDNM